MNISIVIPSFNGRALVEKHLPSVIQACQTWDPSGKKREIIVVDDASTDGTEEWLKKNYPEIRVVRNDKNLRFARSCNRGVRAAGGEIIVLLNNDVQPDAEFLAPLVKHFSDPTIFAVGCREINRINGEKRIGGRGVSDFRRGLVVHWRPENQHVSTASWVSAGSAAFARSIWMEIGGMDRLFRPAYEEDRDLCWQALKAGYRVIFEPKSEVWHDHESTNRRFFGQLAILVYSFKNQVLFVWKNISSPSLVMKHVLWLPYHLIFSTIRSRGMFLVGFFFALFQFPEALHSRRRAAKMWTRSDEQILALANK